jgi:hypothetical protein
VLGAHVGRSWSPPPALFVIRRMIVVMIDANYISERLASLKGEMSDLRVANARYWSRQGRTALDKSASALRLERLLQIKQELADLMKRCA